jgi:hypothetical protein
MPNAWSSAAPWPIEGARFADFVPAQKTIVDFFKVIS